jgi:quinol monooxygenase YgiN
MVALIFGSALTEKYELVAFQLIYSLGFYHLLHGMSHNVWSLDHFFFGGKPPAPHGTQVPPSTASPYPSTESVNNTAMSVLVRYHLKPGAIQAARPLFAAHVRDSRADDGCLEFSARQSDTEPEWFTLTEIWRDPTALQAHRASSHYSHLRAEMQPLLAEDPQVQPGRLVG